MVDGDGLQERLRKIEALMAGAGTPGERDAAGAALERVKARLAEQSRRAPPIELQFSMPDAWSRQLFVALCRRYGLRHLQGRWSDFGRCPLGRPSFLHSASGCSPQ